MSRDIFTSVSGASAAWTHLEVVGNNLANVSTTGFKAHVLAFEAAGNNQHVTGQVFTRPSTIGPDLVNGELRETGNAFHVALQGRGFLQLEGGRVTRDGRLSLNDQGELVHMGLRVMGDGGPIQLEGTNPTMRIAEDGRIFGDDGEVGRLNIVTGAVRPIGGNLWEPDGGPLRAVPEGEVTVVQGALEESNVDAMSSMVELVEAGRYFEAYQKAMQASDEMDRRILEMGR